MPFVSMVGIVFMTAVTVALRRDDLLQMGVALIVICIIHNLAGFVLRHLSCRIRRRDESSCRTIAFEVGL